MAKNANPGDHMSMSLPRNLFKYLIPNIQQPFFKHLDIAQRTYYSEYVQGLLAGFTCASHFAWFFASNEGIIEVDQIEGSHSVIIIGFVYFKLGNANNL